MGTTRLWREHGENIKSIARSLSTVCSIEYSGVLFCFILYYSFLVVAIYINSIKFLRSYDCSSASAVTMKDLNDFNMF